MKVNGKNININNIVEEVNIDKNILKKRNNGLVLRDSHIEILKRNGINYETHANLKSLIYEIEEEILNGNDDEELDLLCEELAEIDYYNYTNK